jgi:hypothetical protein
MFEPVWFFQKSLSAVAEALAALLAGIGFALHHRRRPASRDSSSA